MLEVRIGLLLLVYLICMLAPLHQVFAFSTLPLVLGNVSDISPDADLTLIEPSKPVVVDISYRPLSLIMAGSQYVVSVNATNRDEIRDWASVVIVEIRDSSGVTQWLNWHSQIVSANSTIGLGISWSPEHPDTYLIRTLVVSSLTEPRLLSGVSETEVMVR